MCLVDTNRAALTAADIELPSTKYYYDAHFLPYSAEVLASSLDQAIGQRQGDSNSSRDNSHSGESEGR